MNPITIPIQFRHSPEGPHHNADTAFAFFQNAMMQTPSLRYASHSSWQIDPVELNAAFLGTALFTYTQGFPDQASFSVFLKRGDAFVCFTVNGQTRLNIWVTSKKQSDPTEIISMVHRMYPPCSVKLERQAVLFKFWNTGPKGPRSNARVLDVPRWEEIAQNYSVSTRELLGSIMKMDIQHRPPNDPKLLLWSGKPGGGKTFGIRALAWELRAHANFEYIVDPESLFSDSSYFTDVLLNGRPSNDDDDDDDMPTPSNKWRVLVMEDTGELLAADAKTRTGQGLSRLLNVMDGLIGQGLRLMILITTNEDLGQLHPAVTRPGRCASNINFLSFQPADASAWLASHGVTRTVSKPHTLAELFAIRHDEELKTNWENKAGVGFLAEELSVKS